MTATVDAYPDTDLGTLENKVISIFNYSKNKTLRTVLKDICPENFTKEYRRYWNISTWIQKCIASVVKMKENCAALEGASGNDNESRKDTIAVVADSGIPLTEVDTRSVRSLFSNLYVTGFTPHRRPSGGYSLQLCWTTGYVAGMAV